MAGGERKRVQVENTIGLLCDCLSKDVDLSHFTEDQLDAIARELNERPPRPTASTVRVRFTLAWSAALQ